MIVPVGAPNVTEAIRMGSEIFTRCGGSCTTPA